MIDYDTFHKIRQHRQMGMNASQIALLLELDRRTVEKWINQESYCGRAKTSRSSKLDPYKPMIRRLLEKYPYTSTQIFHKIREEGYPGGLSILKEYIRVVRPPKKPAFLTLTFAPGAYAQVDWGQFGTVNAEGTQRRLSFFVMTMCYSRKMYLEFVLSERMEHWLQCHVNAFNYFNGTPENILIDNLKCGVLDHPRGGPPRFHPRYLELAAHYGFKPVACNPCKPHEKGRVENAVGYVKKNFLQGLDISSYCELEPAARQWLDCIANLRIHGRTKRKPAEVFEAEEKAALIRIPTSLFDSSVLVSVRADRQFRVTFQTNRYSVPCAYAGRRIEMKVRSKELCFYHENQLIARHRRSYGRHQDVVLSDHERPLIEQKKRAKSQQIYRRFLTLSPKANLFYEGLRQRRLNANTHLRKIVALSDIYDPETLRQALEDAIAFEAYSSEYIINILEQRLRLKPPAGALHIPHKEDLLDLSLPEADCSIYEPAKE